MAYKDPEKQKAARRAYDEKRKGRTRNFATVVYPESAPDGWQQALRDTHVQAFISPLHDRDVNPDGTPKKPHYHVLVMFDMVKSQEQAREFFAKIGGVGLEELNTLRGYARYLIHADNPEKAQYNASDVQELNGADYAEICALPSDKYRCIREMTAWCHDNGVTMFCDLFDYARDNRDDWYRALCDNSAFVVMCYLKSAGFKIMYGVEKREARKGGKQECKSSDTEESEK